MCDELCQQCLECVDIFQTLESFAVSMLLISMHIALKMDGKLGYRNNLSLTSISFLSKGKNDFI